MENVSLSLGEAKGSDGGGVGWGGVSFGDWISTHICAEGTVPGVGDGDMDLGAKARGGRKRA